MLKAKGLLVLKLAGLLLLGVLLLQVIIQPAFPSGWIIKKMANVIDPQTLPADRSFVICFRLSGKGGGNYSLVASRKGVETVNGTLDQADLMLVMQAKEFNKLMFSLAIGGADENAFRKLVIAKVMRVAGDMTAFETVFKGAKKSP